MRAHVAHEEANLPDKILKLFNCVQREIPEDVCKCPSLFLCTCSPSANAG